MIRQRLFTIAAALSLLIFVASMAMWVRSYRVTDMLLVDLPRHRTGMEFSRGVVLIVLNRPRKAEWRFEREWHFERETLPPIDEYDYVFNSMAPDYRTRGALGCYFLTASFGWGLLLPIWLLTIASGILPIAWINRRTKRKRTPGPCTSCGYNLTANTSGVCPECGTPVTHHAKIPA